MKRVAITGGTGFIGRRLVSALALEKVHICLLARHSQVDFDTIFYDCKSHLPSDLLTGVDTIFHLAGLAHDFRNTKQAEALYKTINVDATARLVELAISSGVKRFVFLSSVKAGGNSSLSEFNNEKEDGEPESIYGKTKREAELKLLSVCHQSDLHVSIVRSSLVYGPGMKGNLGLMISGIEKGWFPPLPETGNRRSMIHVDDLVRALLLVAEDGQANGEIFIATDGEPHSSSEIYDAMCNVLDKSKPRWRVPEFLFDIASRISPSVSDRVKKLLGDEYYSSEKLQSLGFKVQRSLGEMNETSF